MRYDLAVLDEIYMKNNSTINVLDKKNEIKVLNLILKNVSCKS